MNGDDHARLWATTTASELAVTLKPGISTQAGRHTIQRALRTHSSLSVDTDTERRAEVSAVLGSTLSRLNDTTIVVLVAAIASVITLMLAAIWQRKDRLDSLMSLGMSTGQFARLISYETGAVLLTGCVIGLIAGIAGQDLIDGWLHQTTGASVHFTPSWQIALRTLIIAAVISLLATVIAVAQTGGFQPREAFSTD
jgi:ABC-type antimicrobial peptide transport system permease subunit